jgi:hypothetical protein
MPTDGKTFELTESLVTLLRNSYVDDRLSGEEYGAAQIDPKRPYGNGDVEADIAELLGLAWADDEDDENVNDDIKEHCAYLHSLTPQALQVVLSAGSFEPGTYVTSSRYGNDWKRA